ncbi:squalene-hopene/tetraprenyl-beta-curcumene cyclase [Methylomarinovum caldicuralii]|uniref:Squalene-hopene/tetraprenyl-beta-curcumene cyclase n=1 Tax=Methylomarinovum caldicuralii TaxID=438856 RepID=A0AAU9CIV9_9GAMM|nr:squalene--hopene cyclase [Methylomarinovum caldicuralii]BCX81541.1 squalene-hopene/tetraprenyl-beta-curcumene cyclase [Methylomarinovum caldicuralii]
MTQLSALQRQDALDTARDLLDQAIARARDALLADQHPEGYWLYEFEADCTIPSEYILMMHHMDEVDEILQARLANYIRARQQADGSWPLYTGGRGDISCSVKAYYALKLAGDSPDAPHMRKARDFILSQGGAAKANVFTRIMLAMFRQIPWRGVPFIPVEIMLFPKWFPFHLDKVSYWSRTVMVPLFILCSLKVKARNPRNVHIRELFVTPPEQEKGYFSHVKTPIGKFVLALERIGLKLEPFIPFPLRQRALEKALAWSLERANGEDGLGGIFPAMVNLYEAMDAMGIPPEDPRRQTAKKALQKLLIHRDHESYCQPCLSPVWDTGLAVQALQEVAEGEDHEPTRKAIGKALDWLVGKQLRDEPGDWRVRRPHLEGGGWAFQFNNTYYPDVDDTAVVAHALLKSDRPHHREAAWRAARWIAGMQSKNGGYGAFDPDNTYHYLNHIPFADHGALLDPPEADVSARCVMLLAELADEVPYFAQVRDRCLKFLWNEQEDDGSWFGRWGTNYIYGTWSVLMGIEEFGIPGDDPRIRKAVAWLKSVQRQDGGWGESNDSYEDRNDPAIRGRFHTSMACHTAWALLALMAAGETDSEAVRRGVEFLLRNQQENGLWRDEYFNAPGFPRVFYLKYYGYDRFFPLWALARYRNETAGRC